MHKTLLGVYIGLIWLSYFDPRKDNKKVWWRSEDVTDTRMSSPCLDRDTPRMKCPFKGRLFKTNLAIPPIPANKGILF